MMRLHGLHAGAAAAVVFGTLVAFSSPGPATRPAAPAKSSPSGQDILQLAWMAGTWTGTEGGTTAEEHWMAPKGGMMLGIHRDVSNGRAVFFEFLRIEETAEGLAYQAQPLGRPAVRFLCKELSASRVIFENLQHDYPQRILYKVGADGALHARVEGMQDGALRAEEWTWRRQP